VTDQGIGIPERDRERIFERFYRVDPARSRATGGTGLGLAIVKHVTAAHGGNVTVWSQQGGGSTFTLKLPIRPRHAISPTGSTASAAAGSATGNAAGKPIGKAAASSHASAHTDHATARSVREAVK
jgi:two-component system sensor histidine kinase SenX3